VATKRSKRYREGAKLVDVDKHYTLPDAIKVLKSMPAAKTDQTVSLAFKLTVDPRQSDQVVRGTVNLPHGSGKKVRVLVFAKGKAAEAATAAGADIVGFEELIKKVSEGFQDFDVAVATPEAMQEVRKLGRVLGPRGLMPNPKTGTVSEDTAAAVTACKAGRVEFKIDKAANLHIPFGRLTFTEEQLVANCRAVTDVVLKAKPASAKGTFIARAVMSATYSPGVRLDVAALARN
jgi:large subunit ribosomal protein L1